MPIDEQRRNLDRVLRALGIKLDGRTLSGIELAEGRNLLYAFPHEHLSAPVGAKSHLILGPHVAVWTRWPLSRFDLPQPSVYLQIGPQSPCDLTGFFSSRLGRSLEMHGAWFAALRTTCQRLSTTEAVLTANDQTAFRFLRRLADSIPFHLVVLLQTTTAKLSQCLKKLRQQQTMTSSSRITWMLRVVASAEQIVTDDEAVAELCHELRVLAVRPRGNIARLIADQLQRPDSKRVLIRTVLDQKAAAHVQSLLHRGAIAWHVFDPARESSRASAGAPVKIRPLLRLKDIDPTRYLSHFTRRQPGRWTDESDERYLDALLFGLTPTDRGAGMTLLRIVLQRLLIADNRITRDQSRVVCFTSRLLSDFAALRTFRSHLARWDYEPYGIAIDRKVLSRLGVRPVVYGDESTWQSLDPADRPFFQVAHSETSDWGLEQEWRVVGDVNLDSIAPGDAVIFVPSADEASRLSAYSRWPAVVLSE